jgi:hypothetical protein
MAPVSDKDSLIAIDVIRGLMRIGKKNENKKE